MLWTAVVVLIAAVAAAAVRAVRLSRRMRELDALARSLPGVSPGASGASGDAAARLRGTIEELGRILAGQGKELARRGRNLESLIDAMDEPLIATGAGDRVLLCNRSAEMFLGGTEGRGRTGEGGLVGRPIASVFTHEDLLEMHSAARAGQTRRGRVRLTTPLGQRVFQVSATPLPAAWGEGVFGALLLLRDVTDLHRSEQVRSDFVANASHELRTPIAAIRSAVETLLDGAKDDPAMAERLLRMAMGHADRLTEMSRDLLDLSRLESPDPHLTIAPVDLEQVAGSLREHFADACRARRLELAIELDARLEGMRTDPHLLMLILRNLVENATKFAYEGTTVRVVAKRIEPPEGGAAGRFEVIDRGVGIPMNLRERVFERYFQVDPARGGSGLASKGTGLGLAIVKHAVKVLGGEVGLESVYREGTTVWVEVPLELAETSGAPAA